ncbi:MAG TPA: retropepsin-like aspartic protease [Gemmataceae bacterium]|jgi:predicted aspartyl protease|nr:retropepsin-like aspartic protease [Gemmataceae bacterium]
METATMGRVVVPIKIENLEDTYRARKGEIAESEIRTVEVADALVDTGASTLLLPATLIRQLGLFAIKTQPLRTAGGPGTMTTYSAVRLTLQGRDCTLDVGEIGDGLPVLVGQIPLELLDWIVDPKRQRLIGNPDHGGQHMIDALGALDPN